MKLIIATTALLLAGSATLAETGQNDSGWAGTYAGVTFSTAAGENDYYGDGSLSSIYALEGLGYGGFIGYRQNVGSLTIGGEVAYIGGPAAFETGFGAAYFYPSLMDVKATVGHSFSSALAFASVGYSTATFQGGTAFGSIGGWLVGVGVDVMMTDSFFMGAEYVYRDMSNDDYWDPNDGLNGQISTLQVRAGYRF